MGFFHYQSKAWVIRFPKIYIMSRFCYFSSLTFDDLSRPQMTSDPKNNYRFLKHKLSAFQKHIVWKKSKKSLFRSIFKYVLLSVCPCVSVSVCLCVCTSCTSLHLTAPHLPSLTIPNPQSSILNPQSSVLSSWLHSSLFALLIVSEMKPNQKIKINHYIPVIFGTDL